MKFIIFFFLISFSIKASCQDSISEKKVNFGFTVGRSLGHRFSIKDGDVESSNPGAKIGYGVSGKYTSEYRQFNYGVKAFVLLNLKNRNRFLIGFDYQQFGKESTYWSASKSPIFDSTSTHIADASTNSSVSRVFKYFSIGFPVHYEIVIGKMKKVKPFLSFGLEPRLIVGNSINEEFNSSSGYNMKDTSTTQIAPVRNEGMNTYSLNVPQFNTSFSLLFGLDFQVAQKLNCRLEFFTHVLIRRIDSHNYSNNPNQPYGGGSLDNYINLGLNIGLVF